MSFPDDGFEEYRRQQREHRARIKLLGEVADKAIADGVIDVDAALLLLCLYLPQNHAVAASAIRIARIVAPHLAKRCGA